MRWFGLMVFLWGGLYGVANEPDDDRDLAALKEWIASKRSVTVKERGGNLSISGDVRTEYVSLNEKKLVTSNEQQIKYKNIGSGSLHPAIAQDQFDVEFNLLLDYRNDTNWASIKIEFDNNMGVFNGTQNRLSLERAFLGFRMVEKDLFTIDAELGRRTLNYYFDSQIQFASFMDGILLKYNQSTDRLGDLYIYGGPFIVNENRDQFAYVMEVGLLNIWQTGFYGKYSLVDWYTKHFEDPILLRRFMFFNSQFILGYRFVAPKINQVTTLYGSFLVNSAARRYEVLNRQLANLAWYVGFQLGETRQKGDWSLNFNYQYVEPQAVSDYDFNGIGKVGADGIGLYTVNVDGSGREVSRGVAMGRANFYGWKAEFMYLITNNMTVLQSFAMSNSLNYLPTKYSYKKYKLEFIYAF